MLQYTVFLTGANRGLGLEFVRQYASDNWRVFASCRNLVQAKELQQLALHFGNITLLQLDVNNPIQLNQLNHKYTDLNIDLLINNAGIQPHDNLNNISPDLMKQTLFTNTIAPLIISHTFSKNIARSHLKTIVSISSKMGSINDNQLGEFYSFRTSKVALNMAMKNLAIDLKKNGIKVFTLHPGHRKMEFLGKNSAIGLEESVTSMRSLLLRLTQKETGNFYDHLGNPVMW